MLLTQYYSGHQIEMRWTGHVAGMREICIQGFGVETWGKETTWRRTRLQLEDNIKMVLQEVGCGGMDWIDLAQDRDR